MVEHGPVGISRMSKRGQPVRHRRACRDGAWQAGDGRAVSRRV